MWSPLKVVQKDSGRVPSISDAAPFPILSWEQRGNIEIELYKILHIFPQMPPILSCSMRLILLVHTVVTQAEARMQSSAYIDNRPAVGIRLTCIYSMLSAFS